MKKLVPQYGLSFGVWAKTRFAPEKLDFRKQKLNFSNKFSSIWPFFSIGLVDNGMCHNCPFRRYPDRFYCGQDINLGFANRGSGFASYYVPIDDVNPESSYKRHSKYGIAMAAAPFCNGAARRGLAPMALLNPLGHIRPQGGPVVPGLHLFHRGFGSRVV